MNECLYCNKLTNGVISLGRGKNIMEYSCCKECYDDINKLTKEERDDMAETSFILYNVTG